MVAGMFSNFGGLRKRLYKYSRKFIGHFFEFGKQLQDWRAHAKTPQCLRLYGKWQGQFKPLSLSLESVVSKSRINI